MKILIEESVLRQALDALSAAGIFMRNGIALGYIRMPDDDCPDPAKETPSVVGAAITALRTALDAAEGVEPVAMVCNHRIMPLNMDGVAVGDVLFTHPAPAVPEKVEPVCWMQSNHLTMFKQRHSGSSMAMVRCSDHKAMDDFQPLYAAPTPPTNTVVTDDFVLPRDIDMTPGKIQLIPNTDSELREAARAVVEFIDEFGAIMPEDIDRLRKAL